MTQLLVLAHYTITAGQEDTVLELVPQLAEASRTEPGCLAFDAYQKVGDRRDVMLIERYVSREAFAAHRDTPHFHELEAPASSRTWTTAPWRPTTCPIPPRDGRRAGLGVRSRDG